MFHYRLALSNNSSRLSVAVLLAIVMHMGFMKFELEPGPVSVPEVELPQSVTVFLGKQSTVQPASEPHKTEPAPRPVKKKLQEPQAKSVADVPVKIPVRADKPPKPVLEEITEQAAAAKNIPARQETSLLNKTAEQPRDIQMNGSPLPGTIQNAYPRYRLNAPPAYPFLAWKRKQQGTVILKVLVNEEGRADDLKIDVSSNVPMLDRAAEKAVRNWEFVPGRRGNKKVSMWIKVPVKFEMK